MPHSDISGSKLACSSPKLIAACHVLLRLPVPRHPPFALSSLTKKLAMFQGELQAQTCAIVADYPATTKHAHLSKNKPIRGLSLWRAATAKRSVSQPFGSVHALSSCCGDNRDRTGNLRLARAALSQLSYIPVSCSLSGGPCFEPNKTGPFCFAHTDSRFSWWA